MALIREKLPPFADHLEKIIADIRAAVKNFNGELCETKLPDDAAKQDALRSPLLAELAAALESQNTAAIDRVLEELMKMPPDPGTKAALEKISDNVLMAEYDNALEIVREISVKNDCEI